MRQRTPSHVRSLMAAKTATGLSVRPVQIIHATLRAMLAEAVRDELVERNVAAIVRGSSASHKEVRTWSLEAAGAFLEAAETNRLHALFAVGVALALRRGELLGLRWADVDLDDGMLRVRQTVQWVYGVGLITGLPRSLRSCRGVPLPTYAVQVLREHRSHSGRGEAGHRAVLGGLAGLHHDHRHGDRAAQSGSGAG